jgi:prepilin-type processing-associated H-X9-DG protein
MSSRARRRLGAEFWVGLIVVIGIVVVMVPILRRASQMARTVRCRQQIMLIHQALRSYVVNSGGVLPGDAWRERIDDHIDPAEPRQGLSVRWSCPECGSYVGNAALFGSTRPLGEYRFERSVGLMADGVDPLPEDALGRHDHIAWRHRDGANVIFLDGHVEYVRRRDAARIRRYWDDPEQASIRRRGVDGKEDSQ